MLDEEAGTWSGMIGMVHRNEVDFALGPFGVRADRARAVDYTLPVYIGDLTAVAPLRMEKNHHVLAQPFGWKLWLTIFILPPVFLLTMILSDLIFNRYIEVGRLSGFVSRTVFQQSTPKIPASRSYQRIYSITWLCGCYVLSIAYTGINFHFSLRFLIYFISLQHG